MKKHVDATESFVFWGLARRLIVIMSFFCSPYLAASEASTCAQFNFYAPSYELATNGAVLVVDSQQDSYGGVRVVNANNSTPAQLDLNYFTGNNFYNVTSYSIAGASGPGTMRFHPTLPYIAVGLQTTVGPDTAAQLQIYDISTNSFLLLDTATFVGASSIFASFIRGLAWNSTGTRLAIFVAVATSNTTNQGFVYVFDVNQSTGLLTQLATTGVISGTVSASVTANTLAWDSSDTFIAVQYHDGDATQNFLKVFELSLNYPASLISAGVVNPVDNAPNGLDWGPNQNILVAGTRVTVYSYNYNPSNPASSTLSQIASSFTPDQTNQFSSAQWQNPNCFMVSQYAVPGFYPGVQLCNVDLNTGVVASTCPSIEVSDSVGSQAVFNARYFTNQQYVVFGGGVTPGVQGFVTLFPLIPGAPGPADLAIQKTVDSSQPTVGQIINYTIMVTNNGPYTAQTVEVDDVLPAGLSYVSSSATQGSYNALTGRWSVGAMLSGSMASLTISAAVAAVSGTIITNTATVVDPYASDPYSGNNSSSASIIVAPSADLLVTKTVSNSSPIVGQQVVYTIVVSNRGQSSATAVQANDLLPVGVTYVASVASQGSYNALTGVWNIGALLSDASATLTITVQVNLGTIGQNIINTVNVFDAYVGDIYPGNNTASVAFTATSSFVEQNSMLFWRIRGSTSNQGIIQVN